MWGTTSIVAILNACIEWTTLVVDTLVIHLNYNYTRLYEYTGNYYQKGVIDFHRSTQRTAPRFPFAVRPGQNNIRTQQTNTKQKMMQ